MTDEGFPESHGQNDGQSPTEVAISSAAARVPWLEGEEGDALAALTISLSNTRDSPLT